MPELNNPADNEKLKRMIKKTNRKMTYRIAKICILCLAVIYALVNIPNVLYAFEYDRISKAQKQAMLVYQFSIADGISGYSVENNGISFDKQILLYYNNFVGKKRSGSDSGEIALNYSLFNGKLDMYYPILGAYMHQARYDELSLKYQARVDEDNEAAMRALEKNKDNTVTLINLSLKQSYSIEEIIELCEEYDIEINWFAIECGYEANEPPEYIGMPMQQYYTWGFPYELYTPETIFEPAALDEDGIEEYLDIVKENVDWMYNNQNLMANDIWMVDDNVYENLMNSPWKCYGIQVNGPTDEIYKLVQEIEVTYINIVDFGHWYW